MITWILFDVIGEPKPQPKIAVDPKTGASWRDSSADMWKNQIRAALLGHKLSGGVVELRPPETAFGICLVTRLERPKGHWRTGRFSGMLKPNAPRHHVKRPDADNLLKAVCDAIGNWEGLPAMVWCDDSQIVWKRTQKRFVAPGEQQGASIAIWSES